MSLGVGIKTFNRIIETIPVEKLKKVNIRRFGPKSTKAYTVEQQEIIREYVDEWKNRKGD